MSPAPALKREISLLQATSINMIDMVGIGPFVVMPMVIGMMGIVSDHCFMHRLAHDTSMRHNVIGKLYYSNHMQHHAHPNHLQYGGTFAIMDVLGRTFPTKKEKGIVV